jgi:hypothetical protein
MRRRVSRCTRSRIKTGFRTLPSRANDHSTRHFPGLPAICHGLSRLRCNLSTTKSLMSFIPNEYYKDWLIHFGRGIFCSRDLDTLHVDYFHQMVFALSFDVEKFLRLMFRKYAVIADFSGILLPCVLGLWLSFYDRSTCRTVQLIDAATIFWCFNTDTFFFLCGGVEWYGD